MDRINNRNLDNNIFAGVARALCQDGEDMERVARDLARCLHAVIFDGTGQSDPIPEIKRLLEDWID